jgi:hypothetical protein
VTARSWWAFCAVFMLVTAFVLYAAWMVTP